MSQAVTVLDPAASFENATIPSDTTIAKAMEAIAAGQTVRRAFATTTYGEGAAVGLLNATGSVTPESGRRDRFCGVAKLGASGAGVPLTIVTKGYVAEARVDSDVAAGDPLCPSKTTSGALATCPLDIETIVDGANANTNITVAGLRAEHTISVLNLTDLAVVAGCSVTADNTLQSTNSTAAKKLLVIARAPFPVGTALQAAAEISSGSGTYQADVALNGLGV